MNCDPSVDRLVEAAHTCVEEDSEVLSWLRSKGHVIICHGYCLHLPSQYSKEISTFWRAREMLHESWDIPELGFFLCKVRIIVHAIRASGGLIWYKAHRGPARRYHWTHAGFLLLHCFIGLC